jgi:hypothetical protein
MPIEELTQDEVLQRCAVCQTATRVKLGGLSLGVGSTFGDDVDARVLRLPRCPSCKAEEFLIRSATGEPTAAKGGYAYLHRLLVDQLHASLAQQGRFDSRLKALALSDLAPATVKEFFPHGLKLLAPAEKAGPVK